MNIVTFLEMAASADPSRIALGSDVTYADLLASTSQMAGHLADAPPGVVYATMATAALPVALFAAAWTGRPFVPVSYRLADEPLKALLRGQAPALVIAEGRPAEVAATVDGLEIHTPAQAMDLAGAAPEPVQDPDLPCVLLHTSGTTAAPKVAVLRHRHLTSYVLGSVDFLSADPGEATLISVPPYHIAGVAGLLTALYAGRRIVQLPAFEAAEWVRLARQQRVTHAMVVPTMLARIVSVLEEDGDGLPYLRHLSYGGGRMPAPVIERALHLLPHVGFVNAYGLTETSSSIAVLGPEEHRQALAADAPEIRRRLRSVGRPLPTVEIVVRDSDGNEAERGELWVRGAQVSGEYAHGTLTDTDGWFRTRDGGWIDEDGYVFVEGRLDDVIVRGGENLSPGEIEDVLIRHPGVAEAAVWGVPDDQWGEVVAAAVVPCPGAAPSAEELRTWVGERLRSSRVPAHIVFRAALPRNDMGKLMRRLLKGLV
ncbi:class I adenylate-forming enzyme family protein [Nonomuraea sp. 10N515B]|uniref:class I adenylate-forming enzyme family protein n=1 Tax=Nonomuraea sp. 10N515B TaxID=3457422 RepID=UPI003FCD12E3